MRPEMPYLAAGATAIVGGAIRDNGWPSEGAQAAIGTLIMVIFASATAGTKIAPLVRAIGMLLLLASVMATTKAIQGKKKG